jgi:hypothetical protein
MATQTQETQSGLVPYRVTVRQFKRMIDARVFPGRGRIELLGGRLVERMTKNDPHTFANSQLGDDLRRMLPDDLVVRQEGSADLGRYSRPEPDLVIVRGPHERYRAGAPQPEDILLVIEVADSTYKKDRGPMWQLYASAGLPCYWIVNIPKRVIEVYESPSGRGKAAAYGGSATFGESDEVPVVVDGRVIGRIAVNRVLP